MKGQYPCLLHFNGTPNLLATREMQTIRTDSENAFICEQQRQQRIDNAHSYHGYRHRTCSQFFFRSLLLVPAGLTRLAQRSPSTT